MAGRVEAIHAGKKDFQKLADFDAETTVRLPEMYSAPWQRGRLWGRCKYIRQADRLAVRRVKQIDRQTRVERKTGRWRQPGRQIRGQTDRQTERKGSGLSGWQRVEQTDGQTLLEEETRTSRQMWAGGQLDDRDDIRQTGWEKGMQTDRQTRGGQEKRQADK
jgi:hypothetical protein